MQINKIETEPNFQAKFIKNEAIMRATREQLYQNHFKTPQSLEDKNTKKFIDALNNLSKHNTSTTLLLKETDRNNYQICNLNNNQTITIEKFNAEEIEQLNNKNSSKYKILFEPSNPQLQQINNLIDSIADKYYTDTIPDYTPGHELDASI